MRSTSVQPGEELRGYVVKLYPTQEQLQYLGFCQLELMNAWNVLVTSRETHVEHCVRHAEDNGLIGPVPPRPTWERDTKEPEQIADWLEYARLCGLRRYEAMRLTRDVEGLTWADWRVDYKTLRELFGGKESIASAQMFLGVVDTFRKTKGPRLKRRPLHMPLLNRTGGVAIIFDGEPTTRTTATGKQRLTSSHRCLVRFGHHKIKARFHRPPPGPFIEGISIKLASDGWYASAKVRVIQVPLSEPTKDVIAINPGLECIYADSEGHVIENPRGNEYSLKVRDLSNWVDEADETWEAARRRNVLARYQERFARRVTALIYEQVIPRLADYRSIVISTGGKRAAQGPQNRISKNDEGGYVSSMSLMKELIVRCYGEGRVREVESVGISRRCSQCGTEHSTRYQRNNSRRRDQITDCQNPSCRLHIHVDVNAARNLLAKHLGMQDAAE